MKDYVLVQEVESSWRHNHHQKSMASKSPAGHEGFARPSIPKKKLLKKSFSANSDNSYKQQRSMSLCIFYNANNIVNIARNTMAHTKDNLNSSTRIKDSSQRNRKILQNHEKILEVQNRWTGNGRLIVMDRTSASSVVSDWH